MDHRASMAGSNDDTPEKRTSDREPVTLLVEYEGADDFVGDYTENLSTGGTFVATNRELPVGTQIKLVLSFPGLLAPIAIEGTVRWTRDDAHGAGAGIQFAAGPARDQLAAGIERIRPRDPRCRGQGRPRAGRGERAPRQRDPRQARGQQPRRLGEGPPGDQHDPARRGARRDQAG